MLRLRLEVQPSACINEVCSQATRIATHLGIEVVFELAMLGKDVVAKPGMAADSLLNECSVEPTIKGDTPTIPQLQNTGEPKAAGKKGGKQKDQAPAPAVDANQTDVQKEGI